MHVLQQCVKETIHFIVQSQDDLNRELEELNNELRMQGHAELALSRKLYRASWNGHLHTVKFLVDKKHCSPMQKDQDGIAALHVAALEGNVQMFKYFVTESNCNPAYPGPLMMSKTAIRHV